MVKRMIVTLAALLAVFTLAATSANATTLAINTGTGFSQPNFTGAKITLVGIGTNCAASPNAIQSATVDSDSMTSLYLYANSNCATPPIAVVEPGGAVAVTAAFSYNFA